MDECWAWLYQGVADHDAAVALSTFKRPEFGCHVIAKLQQSVEKNIKSIIAALRDAEVLAIEIGWAHSVSRFMKVMLRLPRFREIAEIQRSLQQLLDPMTRETIAVFDELVPHRPVADEDPQRNTEYPFRQSDTWTYPARIGVFGSKEIDKLQATANRIRTHAPRIVSALRRKPRNR